MSQGSQEGVGATAAGGSRRQGSLPSFTVEFGDACCRTITINTLKLRVRGAFAISTLHKRDQGGRDIGAAMARMPDIPGMRLAFDGRTRQARLFDPLEESPDLLARINAVSKAAPAIIKTSREWTFVPATTHDFSNADRLKTLLHELALKRESKSLTIIEGDLPTLEMLDAIPGRRLNDPWNSSAIKPRYADDPSQAVAET